MRGTHDVDILVLIVGTQEDPQNLDSQRQRLQQAGARIFEDSASAAEFIFQRLGVVGETAGEPVPLDGLASPLEAINVGLESFYQSLSGQGAGAVQVEWRPPAGGDDRLSAILEKMRTKS
jgi:FdrA protein